MGLNLAATISLDGSQFERGLTRAGQAVTNAVKGWVVGAIGIYAIDAAIKKTVESAEELVNTSQRLDISIEKLQVFKQAAKDSGTELDSVTTAMEKLGAARALALGQGGTGVDLGAASAFRNLGISQSTLKAGGNNDAIMMAIAQKIKDTANPQTLIEPLKQVFGRSAGALIPFLETNFGDLEGKMKSFGAIMSDDAAIKLKDLSDKFDLTKNVIVAGLAPVLLLAAQGILKMLDAAVNFAEWVSEKTGIGKASAVAGAIEGQLGAKRFLEFNMDAMLGMSVEKLNKKYGIDTKAVVAAVESTTSWYKESTDKISKTLEELIKELQSPAKPLSHGTTIDPLTGTSARSGMEKTIGEDSLTKVGNFLGTSRAAIGGAEHQMLRHAETTATNTTDIKNILGSLGQQLQFASGIPRQFQQDNIYFPSN